MKISRMKILILLTLFVLQAAEASEDDSRNVVDARNDMVRPIYPFEAFNLGFDQFLRRIHPPLLAAMNSNEPSMESARTSESERNNPHSLSSDAETETQEAKSIPSEAVESKESNGKSSASIHQSSSKSERSESDPEPLEPSTDSESVDYIPRFFFDALDYFGVGEPSSESELLPDSHSTVDESEFLTPSRASRKGYRTDKPYAISRSKHDSLEPASGERPDKDTHSVDGTMSVSSRDSEGQTVERLNEGIVDGFEATERVSEQGSHDEFASSRLYDGNPKEAQSHFIDSGEKTLFSENGGSGSKSSKSTESKEQTGVDSVASESLSRTRFEQYDEGGSKSTVSVALEVDGISILKSPIKDISGFDDMALEETCYNGGLVGSGEDGEVELENVPDDVRNWENVPDDVRNWEKVRQELSIQNVRKRLEDGFIHLQEIKKKAMQKNNVLSELNHVIADLEFLCDKICKEIPDKYLDSSSLSF